LDLSVEFYPRDGMISLAVFSKSIKNEIFTLSSTENLDVGRGVEPVLVSTPRNAETAKINGLEFAVQQAFTFLPAPFDGFGFNGNMTLLDTEFTFLTSTGPRTTGLFQQPEITTNESIYYQRGPLRGPGVAQLHRRPAGDDQRRQRQLRPVLEGPPRVRRQLSWRFAASSRSSSRGRTCPTPAARKSLAPTALPAGMGQLRPHLLGRRGGELLGRSRTRGGTMFLENLLSSLARRRPSALQPEAGRSCLAPRPRFSGDAAPRPCGAPPYDGAASQGAAVGPNDVYAVSNFSWSATTRRPARSGPSGLGDKARFPHINSCALIAKDLVCASSNFPGVPQVSTVEIFDPMTLAHKRSVSLGLGTGSVTWVDRHDGFWWAMFANYDGKGGEPPRDHRHTTLVKFDDQWRGWRPGPCPPPCWTASRR
jgi:hypothetical protein